MDTSQCKFPPSQRIHSLSLSVENLVPNGFYYYPAVNTRFFFYPAVRTGSSKYYITETQKPIRGSPLPSPNHSSNQGRIVDLYVSFFGR